MKTICESEPAKPSIALAATERPDPRLIRSLRGDLDNIVLMALRKEPERRYTSADEFARDIQRHLDGLPVHAHQDTLRYRTSKFITRHFTGVMMATAVFFALLAAAIATYWQASVANRERRLAESRFNDVRALANSVLFEIHDSIEPLPGSTKARELLVKRAQEHLARLATAPVHRDSDARLEQEQALAYDRIGDVLGLPTQSNLGKTAEAISSYQKALGIQAKLAARDSSNTALQVQLARTYDRLCRVEQTAGALASATSNCHRAVEIARRLNSRPELAAYYENLAGAFSLNGDWSQAREVLQRALPLTEREGARAVILLELAHVEELMKDFEHARQDVLHALEYFEKAVAGHPADLHLNGTLTVAYQRLGSVLLSLGDLHGALREFERVPPIREALLAADPADARARMNLANSRAVIGITLKRLGRLPEALEQFASNGNSPKLWSLRIPSRWITRPASRVRTRISASSRLPRAASSPETRKSPCLNKPDPTS